MKGVEEGLVASELTHSIYVAIGKSHITEMFTLHRAKPPLTLIRAPSGLCFGLSWSPM